MTVNSFPSGAEFLISVSGPPVSVETVITINGIINGYSSPTVISAYTAAPGENAATIAAGLFNSTSTDYRDNLYTAEYTVKQISTISSITVQDSGSTPVTPPPIPQPPAPILIPNALKYLCEFDRVDTVFPKYSLQIFQKNYNGNTINVTGGAVAAVHRWETDDPKAPIKGSSLEITLVNQGNNIKLSDLLSTDDEEFKVDLIWHFGDNSDLPLFHGFIVQDDSSEIMVDYAHEITLSATDNLGLLKDVAFNKAPASYDLIFTSPETYEINEYAGNSALLVSEGFGSSLFVGDKISVNGAGPYEVKSLFNGGTFWNAYLVEHPANVASTSGTLGVFRNILLNDLMSLLTVVKLCLSATGLKLKTIVYANINEVTQDSNKCFLEQTFIDPQTFLIDTNYEDCYTVLTKVLQRFNLTLFQAKGRWNIVRWDEMRYYDFNIPGFYYDENFNFLDHVFYSESGYRFAGWPKFLIGKDEQSKAETGLLQRITRPYNFTKETFNYKEPGELLRNHALNQLGTLLNSYTTGSGVNLHNVKEYAMPWWHIVSANTGATYFIRVVTDNLGNEIERYAVLKQVYIESAPIQANMGDVFTYSFTVQTADSQSGSVTGIFSIKITDGTQTKFLDESGAWRNVLGWNAIVQPGDNTNQTHTFDLNGTVPFDGLLYFGLSIMDVSGTDNGTFYRDIRLDYQPMINQSTKITGQVHTSSQNINAKNNKADEIYIDNSPRNSISGTLFLNEKSGVLQKRCGLWKRAVRTEQKKLGEITTSENLFLRRVPRNLLEGTFYGLRSLAGDHLSLLSVCRYTYFADLNFVFGRLEIDYRNNHASGTLYEMYKDTEQDSDLLYYYTFEFLYASK